MMYFLNPILGAPWHSAVALYMAEPLLRQTHPKAFTPVNYPEPSGKPARPPRRRLPKARNS